MRGQLRRHFFLDLLARIVGIGLDQAEEDARHAGQGLAAALHRHDGVVEGGRLAAVGDPAHVGQVLAHAFFKRRQVFAVLDLVERRAWNGSVLALSSGLVEASAGCWPGSSGHRTRGGLLAEQAASARLMAAARTTVRDM